MCPAEVALRAAAAAARRPDARIVAAAAKRGGCGCTRTPCWCVADRRAVDGRAVEVTRWCARRDGRVGTASAPAPRTRVVRDAERDESTAHHACGANGLHVAAQWRTRRRRGDAQTLCRVLEQVRANVVLAEVVGRRESPVRFHLTRVPVIVELGAL